MSYDWIAVHQTMLEDRVRTEAYRRAITEVVRPGMRVLDFGCGSGILSFFAEQAGASEVVALDRSGFIRVARMLARRNGFERIRFFHGDAEELDVEGTFDVIVSEWMGHFLFAEPMLGPLLSLRDRYLKAGGQMLPARFGLFAGLLTEPAFGQSLRYFAERPYGFDFSSVATWPAHLTRDTRVAASALGPDVVPLGSLDVATLSTDEPLLEGDVVATASYEVHALVGWFDAQLTPDVVFDTGPLAPETHWVQTVFPLERPVAVRAGDPVRVRIQPATLGDPGDGGLRSYQWAIETGSDRLSHDDLVERAFVATPLAKGFLDP